MALPDGQQAEFTDVAHPPERRAAQRARGVLQLSPGFEGWPDERWLYHCSDVAAYLGRVGFGDAGDIPGAIASLRAELIDLGLDVAEMDSGTNLAYSDAS